MTYNTDLAQYIYSYAEIKMIFVTNELFGKFRKENVRSMVKLRPHTGAIAPQSRYESVCDSHRPKTCVYLISLSIVLKRVREHKLAYEYSEGSSQKTIYQAFE